MSCNSHSPFSRPGEKKKEEKRKKEEENGGTTLYTPVAEVREGGEGKEEENGLRPRVAEPFSSMRGAQR